MRGGWGDDFGLKLHYVICEWPLSWLSSTVTILTTGMPGIQNGKIFTGHHLLPLQQYSQHSVWLVEMGADYDGQAGPYMALMWCMVMGPIRCGCVSEVSSRSGGWW